MPTKNPLDSFYRLPADRQISQRNIWESFNCLEPLTTDTLYFVRDTIHKF